MSRSRRLTAAALTAAAIAVSAAIPATAVWNGSPTYSPDWIVAIKDTSGAYPILCTGTLVSEATILTAAHCLEPDKLPKVVVGGNGMDPNALQQQPVDYRIYPGYVFNGASNKGDLALLRLSDWQDNSGLGLATAEPTINQSVTALGYGCLHLGKPCDAFPSSLQTVGLSITSDSNCYPYLPTYASRWNICTYGFGANVAPGDSGGPLMTKSSTGTWSEVGVTSVGSPIETRPYAGYISVAKYRTWILNNAGVFDDCSLRDGATSTGGGVPSTIKWVNKSNTKVNVYWVDYSGSAVFYESILSGGTFTQRTYTNHAWVAVDGGGACRGYTRSMASTQTYTLY